MIVVQILYCTCWAFAIINHSKCSLHVYDPCTFRGFLRFLEKPSHTNRTQTHTDNTGLDHRQTQPLALGHITSQNTLGAGGPISLRHFFVLYSEGHFYEQSQAQFLMSLIRFGQGQNRTIEQMSRSQCYSFFLFFLLSSLSFSCSTWLQVASFAGDAAVPLLQC